MQSLLTLTPCCVCEWVFIEMDVGGLCVGTHGVGGCGGMDGEEVLLETYGG